MLPTVPLETLRGADHRRIVRQLVRESERMREGHVDAAGCVILRGDPGAGKSRIIREFYGALVAEQPESRYWPPIETAGALLNSLDTCKVLGPSPREVTDSFTQGPGRIPTFAWWSVRGDLGDRSVMDTFQQLAEQVDLHKLAYAVSWACFSTAIDKARRLSADGVERVRELALEASIDEAVDFIRTSVGVTIPFASLLVGWGQLGLGVWHRKRAEAAYVKHGVDVMGRQREAAAEIASAIRDFAHPALPSVLVVGDAHLLPEAALEAVEAIAGGRSQAHPTLVVLSVPTGARVGDGWFAWLRGMRRREYLREVDVPPLSTGDLEAIVFDLAPRTSPPVASAIASAARSPLGVRSYLGMPGVGPRIADEHAVPAVNDAPEIPPDLVGILDALWGTLPPKARGALCVAAEALPLDDHRSVWPFLPDLLGDVCESVQAIPIDRRECDEGLMAAHTAGWLTASGAADVFREPAMRTVALRRSADFLSARTATAVGEATASTLRAWLAPRVEAEVAQVGGAGDPVVAVAARWLLALVDPLDAKTDPTMQTVAALAARTAAGNLDREAARRLVVDYGLVVDRRWTALAEVRWELTEHLARSLWANGNRVGAIRTLTQVAQDTITAQPWLCARLRKQLLDWRGRVPADHEPRGVLIADAAAWERWAGQGFRDSPAHLTLRHEAAFTIGNCGHPARALHLARALLPDQVRVLGENHPHTLNARHNIAAWTAQCGDPAQALHLSRALLPDMVRVLGAHHPDTLTNRSNIAAWTGECGDPAQALRLARALLPDRVRVLGADHPDTLNARHNIAAWTAQCGTPPRRCTCSRPCCPTGSGSSTPTTPTP